MWKKRKKKEITCEYLSECNFLVFPEQRKSDWLQSFTQLHKRRIWTEHLYISFLASMYKAGKAN